MKALATILALALSACGGGGAAPPAPQAHQLATFTVVVEGDSLAADNFAATTWQRDLEAALPQASVVHGAQAGSFAYQILARYDLDAHPTSPAVTGKPGVYIAVAGTNDVRRGIPLDESWATLRALWARARADGFKVIASTVGPCTEADWEQRRRELNALIRSRPDLYDALLPLDAMFPDAQDSRLLFDTLHFSPQGNSMVLDSVMRSFGIIGVSM